MIRVLLADDLAAARAGARDALARESGFRIVGEAGDGAAALEAWQAQQPDVMVAGLAMAAGGPEFIERALALRPEGRVLAMGVHESARRVRRAFDAGARGYVSAPSLQRHLVDALHALHRGERWLAPELPPSCLRRDVLDEAERLAALSAPEFALLQLLAQGGAPLQADPDEAALHAKLGVATRDGLVRLALRHGIVVAP